MFVKCAVVLSVLVGCVVGDDAGYSAPAQGGYAAPSAGYGAPTGGSAYAAPATGYESAAAYDYGYGAVEEEAGGFNLGKLEELIPLFLAVLAAIILAQLLSPLFSNLLVLLIGVLPLGLNIKAPIVNAILNPFNLNLCDVTDPANPTLFPPVGRSMAEEFGFSDETARVLGDTFQTVVETFKSQYMS